MNKLKLLFVYYETIRHLKTRQICYRIYYKLRAYLGHPSIVLQEKEVVLLSLHPSINSPRTYYDHGTFIFLNRSKSFGAAIDWNFADYGKLWAYNLNYFEYLHQSGTDHAELKVIFESYCDFANKRREGIEPYPTSLRGINWIKYFSFNNINVSLYNSLLFSDYKRLLNNVEYHLMGNHLIENGFSLLFGSYFFKDTSFYSRASKILLTELNEQILADGAHFERSPMYHQIILFRLLDCINLLQSNFWKNDDLLPFLRRKASAMLGWLKEVTFRNGDVPMVNDSAYDIAPDSYSLFEYATRLQIPVAKIQPSVSGYRMWRRDGFELFADIGNIGPDYIPGHAHSDTLSYVLYFDGRPVIVDRGVSTYEASALRFEERSTSAHNTVKLNHKEQTEVWSSFRVGKRARIVYVREGPSSISASHDGYKKIDLFHERTWQFQEKEVWIIDEVTGKGKVDIAESSIHFHPGVDISITEDSVSVDALKIQFQFHDQIKLEEYQFAAGFNHRLKAKVLRVRFVNRLKTIISARITNGLG